MLTSSANLSVWTHNTAGMFVCRNCKFLPKPQNIRPERCPHCNRRMQNPHGVFAKH